MMSFLSDLAENGRVYTDNGSMEMAATDLENKDVLMADFSARSGLGTAYAN